MDNLQQRVTDLLTNAIEGGSNYWYMIVDHNRKEVGAECIVDVPAKGGFLLIDDSVAEGTLKEPVKLDLERLMHGLNIMQIKYTRHYNDFINENDDAITGDVFLQCCIFEKVIYG